MFERAGVLFLYAESPLHAGSGSSVGAVDLPIQRERATHYPIVQASGVKGPLRGNAEALERRQRTSDAVAADALKKAIKLVFGPDTGGAAEHGGALSLTDARLLLFPVRSLKGTFAWITCPYVIERFKRDLRLLSLGYNGATSGLETVQGITLPPLAPRQVSVVAGGGAGPSPLVVGGHVYLEEFAFEVWSPDGQPGGQPVNPEAANATTRLATWLAANVLPADPPPAYRFWRQQLQTKLAVLHDDDFQYFVRYGTEVTTRIQLKETGTVGQGPWDEEQLPAESVLYSLALATRPRVSDTEMKQANLEKPEQVLT